MGRERFQGGARLFQGCQRAGLVHAFLHQVCGVVIDLPEEELHQGRGVAQGLQTLLDQRRHAGEKVEVIRRGELVRRVAVPEVEQGVGELTVAQVAYVVAVEPGQLVRVEDRRGAGDALQREGADQLRGREHLRAVVQGPSEQGQEVDHGLREVAHFAVLGDGRGAVPLAELGAVRGQDDGQVGEERRFPPEGLVEAHVARRAGEPLLGPEHVADLHLVVVDHVG